jgi:DNA-binding NarL/FixJ family response regulator
MPHLNGYDATLQVLKKYSSAKCILLTGYDTLTIAMNFIKIGGRGFLLKGDNSEEIIHALRAVQNGDYYFSPHYEQYLVRWLDLNMKLHVPTLKFTPRELEIILKFSKGFTSKEVGESMQLSTRTIETYRYDLLKKTQVKNSAELIRFAFQNGILS